MGYHRGAIRTTIASVSSKGITLEITHSSRDGSPAGAAGHEGAVSDRTVRVYR
jgi:hypothetical protein